MKRIGKKYPGNESPGHAGTNCQEVQAPYMPLGRLQNTSPARDVGLPPPLVHAPQTHSAKDLARVSIGARGTPRSKPGIHIRHTRRSGMDKDQSFMTTLPSQSIAKFGSAMIDPFYDHKIIQRGKSFGLSSASYDLRINQSFIM